MLKVDIGKGLRIEEIAGANMRFVRPRSAGLNARKGVHGIEGNMPVVRIKIGDRYGFGWSRVSVEKAKDLVGMPAADMFDSDGKLKPEFHCIEFPVLDWLGQITGYPVYRIVASDQAVLQGDFRVPTYDTSIYFDDLDIEDDGKAIELLCKEVELGQSLGHRNVKVKIGRGARWMELEKGMKRDIAAILAIRKQIGPDAKLMVDVNNGYNLNLTKRFLDSTREAKLYWIEEPFHEDDLLYEDLQEWLEKEKIDTLVADGEGDASVFVADWACQGLIDVIQYDLKDYGFFNWMELGRRLDAHSVKTAPHNYPGYYGNYVQCHLASAVKGFVFAEWDHASAEGIDTSAYKIEDGYVVVPDKPGFGLDLDDNYYTKLVDEKGWRVKL